MEKALELWGCPDVCTYREEGDTEIVAEVGLPGMGKKEIKLEASEEGFCLKARKGNTVYDSCFRFDERVDVRRMQASFNNGLLKVSAPIDKKELRARHITIS